MKESFVLYTSYKKQIDLLNNEQKGLLLSAIFNYQLNEDLPKMDGMTSILFSVIKDQLDRDNEKYQKVCDKRKQSGKMGGRPKKQEEPNAIEEKAKKANGFCEKQPKAKKADNDYVYEYVYDNEYDTNNNDSIDNQLKEFLDKYPNIQIDILSPTETENVDWGYMLDKFEESEYLRLNCSSLKWVIRNYRNILQNKYKDSKRVSQSKQQNDQFLDWCAEAYEILEGQ
jgi:hypothetical protein